MLFPKNSRKRFVASGDHFDPQPVMEWKVFGLQVIEEGVSSWDLD